MNIICGQWFLFVFFTIITLKIPLGIRRRYIWLSVSKDIKNERLFIGQIPMSMFLQASRVNVEALLREFLVIVCILIVAPAFINNVIWIALQEKAFSIPLGAEIGFWDFLYQSIVTITTTGFGDITPKISLAQSISISQIGLGWMYLLGILPIVLSKLHQVTKRIDIQWNKKASSRGMLLGSTIQKGLNNLRDQMTAVGSWDSCLVSDSTTTFYTKWVLDVAQQNNVHRIPNDIISELD
jgi:hypothetical protein